MASNSITVTCKIGPSVRLMYGALWLMCSMLVPVGLRHRIAEWAVNRLHARRVPESGVVLVWRPWRRTPLGGLV